MKKVKKKSKRIPSRKPRDKNSVSKLERKVSYINLNIRIIRLRLDALENLIRPKFLRDSEND